jgi:hypothetical protein
MRIPLLPADALTPEWESRLAAMPDADPFAEEPGVQQYFGPSGRWLLGAALASLELGRGDEITILTTSNETYVSTCVSVTAFNYCRIGRVPTASTRAIILIHEFGYVSDALVRSIPEWRSRGIVVIEDCAHVIGLDVEGVRVGGFGDFALFSLPKVIPAPSGGLLRTRRRLSLPPMTRDQETAKAVGICAADRYLGKIESLNARRLENAAEIAKHLPSGLRAFVPSPIAIPWVFGALTGRRDEIRAATPEVEWGATLRADLLYSPTNPLVEAAAYRDLFASPAYNDSRQRVAG